MSEKKQLSAEAGPMMIQKGAGRLTCPKCGNVQRNMIREAEDTNHKINDYPVIFGKKFKCGKCGVWWRREEE